MMISRVIGKAGSGRTYLPSAISTAFDAGKLAGRACQPRNNPHGQEDVPTLWRAWESGYSEGRRHAAP